MYKFIICNMAGDALLIGKSYKDIIAVGDEDATKYRYRCDAELDARKIYEETGTVVTVEDYIPNPV